MGLVVQPYNPGFSDYIPFLMTTVQLLTAIFSIIYIARATPRKIILVGNAGMSLCCFGIGICLVLIESYKDVFWVTISCIVLFMGLNGGTFISAVGMYVAEVGTRKYVRWSLVVNWFMAATSVVLFVTIGTSAGYPSVFFGFGVLALVGFIFNIRYMLETKLSHRKVTTIELKTSKKIEHPQ